MRQDADQRTMERIPFLDLAALHRPLGDDLRAAAARVLASERFILGPEVAAFERELAGELGVAEAVGVSSGTDALTALLMAAGVGPGDEVVTTPYSFFATVESIVRLGARPVFADIEPGTMNLDAAEAVTRIGERTKAILVVHLFGRAASTGPLRAACSAAKVPLLEDAAQAIGASGVGAGGGRRSRSFRRRTWAASATAARSRRTIPALAARLRALRNHGAVEKMQHQRIGGNFRLDELQAALLRVKLPHLSRWTAERRRLAALYRERLAGLPIELPPAERRLRLESVRHPRGSGAPRIAPAPSRRSRDRHRCLLSDPAASAARARLPGTPPGRFPERRARCPRVAGASNLSWPNGCGPFARGKRTARFLSSLTRASPRSGRSTRSVAPARPSPRHAARRRG